VPDNKLLSCSIGIASSDNCSGDNIKELLQKADEALYYMKRNHKGSYALWENIHE
jgi:GGDEF domain-containing protein